MKTVKLFVEGGGDSRVLHTKCRQAFNTFLQKTALKGHMPRIVVCGSRSDAYTDYCAAIKYGEEAVLLVDSEAPVIVPSDAGEDIKRWKPWHHLKNRTNHEGQRMDNWDAPSGAIDSDCHLMVELMEAWFLADTEALKEYYGKGFNQGSFPKNNNIEEIAKKQVLSSLSDATQDTKKGKYSKGSHSFEILALINPDEVRNKSPWANRFIVLLAEKMEFQ